MSSRSSKRKKRDNDEITQLIKQVKTKKDDIAFQKILELFKDFIHHTSYKFFIKGSNAEDLVQECYIALRFKAIPDYDKSKGDFLSFGRMCIKRHIITQLKSGNKKRNTALNTALSLDNVTSSEDKSDGDRLVLRLKHDKNSPCEKTISLETINILFKYLRVELTELEKDVFDLFCQKMSYTDIARKLRAQGVKRANEKLVDNAIARMKKKAIEVYNKVFNG